MAEQRLTKASFYAQVGGPLVVDLNEAIDILTEENASLRAEVAMMTEFAKTQQQLAADLENTLVKENAQLIEARAEVALLHQANKEHLVIAEKLNSECQRNEYLAEQVARLEKELANRTHTELDACERARAAEARIRELEGRK